MSQIKFKTKYNDIEVEIQAGYDRPLDDYYMTVFDSFDKPVWSTLDHYTSANKPSIEDLKAPTR